MNLKKIMIATYVLLMISSTSASAYTFNVTSNLSFIDGNGQVTGFEVNFDLVDGDTRKRGKTLSGSVTTTAVDHIETNAETRSFDVIVQSGGETVTETGTFSLYTRNVPMDNPRARTSFLLHSDLSFGFSFGQFVLLGRPFGTASCRNCDAGDTASRDLTMYASFDEVSAVPVPAAVWLFGSALMGLVGLRKKKA